MDVKPEILRVDRFPSGFVQLDADLLTIGGGETRTVARRDLVDAVARAGKKSLLSRNPPAVIELRYRAGTDVVGVKLLIVPDQLAQAERLVARLMQR